MKHDILGEVIKSTRIHRGLSQEQLAEIIDCSPRHIMGIENENKKPGYWRLFNLIRTLNIPADSIFYPERGIVYSEKEKLISELTGLLHSCNIRDIQIITAAVKQAVTLE